MEKERVGQLLIKPSRKKMLNSVGPSLRKNISEGGQWHPPLPSPIKTLRMVQKDSEYVKAARSRNVIVGFSTN